MNGLLEDVRHALRTHLSTPSASGIAIVALAVALACIAATFSLFSELSLKPRSGFTAAGTLTIVQSNRIGLTGLPFDLVERIQSGTGTLQSVTAVYARPLDVLQDGAQAHLQTELVTSAYCETLKPRIRLGRCFQAVDHARGAEPSILLSYRLWKRAFGGRPDILGTPIKLSGRPFVEASSMDSAAQTPALIPTVYRVIGVLAEEVHGTFQDDTDVWVPYERSAPDYVGAALLFRTMSSLNLVGQLRGSARISDVREELNQRFARPDSEVQLAPDSRLDVTDGVVADIQAQRAARRQVLMLFIGSVLLTLVAASNISLFLVSRAPQRQRELAIRAAIGASPRRLMRQMLVESAVIVVLAHAIGLLLSVKLLEVMQHFAPMAAVDWTSVSVLDGPVVLLVLGATFVLIGAVSLAPMVGIRRLGLAMSTRTSRSRATVTQWIAESVQIAIACVLAGVAGAFVWYLALIAHVEPGFKAQDLYVVTPRPPDRWDRPSKAPDKILVDRERIRQVLRSIPGVEAVSFGSAVPGKVSQFVARAPRPQGPPGEYVDMLMVSADVTYPAVLGMPLARGQALEAGQVGPVLVNEALARTLWGRTDVVGQLLGQSRMKIMGVLRDAHFGNPSQAVQPMLFRLVSPSSAEDMVLVRAHGTAQALERQLRDKQALRQLPFEVGSVAPLSEIWGRTMATDRVRTLVAVAVAGMVVVLAGFGFYGTQRYLVQAGRRECAIRSSIGAGPRALFKLVMSRGFTLAAPGVALGALLTIYFVTWLKATVISDQVSTVTVVLLVILAAAALVLASTAGPAMQASNAPPASVLREE